MSTTRQSPRSKSRSIASQPAAQQSSPQSLAGDTAPKDDVDRQRDALANQRAQGWGIAFSLREEEGDDTATRH